MWNNVKKYINLCFVILINKYQHFLQNFYWIKLKCNCDVSNWDVSNKRSSIYIEILVSINASQVIKLTQRTKHSSIFNQIWRMDSILGSLLSRPRLNHSTNTDENRTSRNRIVYKFPLSGTCVNCGRHVFIYIELVNTHAKLGALNICKAYKNLWSGLTYLNINPVLLS